MAERVPPLQESDLARLAALLGQVDAMRDLVSPEQWAEYERCRDSVIEARRYAERMAPFWWIG